MSAFELFRNTTDGAFDSRMVTDTEVFRCSLATKRGAADFIFVSIRTIPSRQRRSLCGPRGFAQAGRGFGS